MTKTRIEEAELIAVERLADKIDPDPHVSVFANCVRDRQREVLAETLRALVAMARESP